MWKISNENDIFKKRKPLPPKKSEESQPELTPWQKQNQEYLKKQAEEAASKGENEQAEVTITLQEQSQEEPQQHLPQETVEEEEHFADRLPNVKKTRNKRLYRRLAFILTCLGTAILVALYFVSPLSRLSEVTVSGNKSVESQAIIQQSKLETGSGLWEQYSNRNYFSANIQKKFPIIKKANIKLNGINSFKIEKWEYGRLNSDYSGMYSIDFKKLNEKMKNIDLTTIRPLKIINQTEKNFYATVKNKNLIIYYNSCYDNAEFNMYSFSKEINEKLHKTKPSKVIIDLRFNGGGRSEFYHQILKELEFYQVLNPETKIKILVGNFTYSASGLATIETMRTLDNVEVIGSDSGFTIKTTTGVDSLFYIKNLKTYCQYAARFIEVQNYKKQDVFKHNYKNYDYERDMLTPDFHAEQSFSDYMIGNDPAMNHALRDEEDSSLFNKIKSIMD